LKDCGHLGRVLLSHDAGWYRVGEPGGGNYRGYDTLFKEFLPHLKKAGLTEPELLQMLVLNPAEAFSVRIRRE
jgi:phosphotriesterase-related protein